MINGVFEDWSEPALLVKVLVICVKGIKDSTYECVQRYSKYYA